MAPAGSKLNDIEHVVVLCQENRSFDHYFGTLSGVIGFDDPNASVDPLTGRTVFEQLDPNPLDGSDGTLLPWRLDPTRPSAQCLARRRPPVAGPAPLARQRQQRPVRRRPPRVRPRARDPDLTQGGIRTMSYFTRADLPFHYALADAFTICDRYFCSVLGPTNPNRLYLMSAWLDPDGTHGGPEINNVKQLLGTASFSWTTYPEQLEAAASTGRCTGARRLPGQRPRLLRAVPGPDDRAVPPRSGHHRRRPPDPPSSARTS